MMLVTSRSKCPVGPLHSLEEIIGPRSGGEDMDLGTPCRTFLQSAAAEPVQVPVYVPPPEAMQPNVLRVGVGPI